MSFIDKVMDHGRFIRQFNFRKNTEPGTPLPPLSMIDAQIAHEINAMTNFELLEFISERLDDTMNYKARVIHDGQ